MSLYNLMNGVNQSAFFILPMLGEKHPDLYPRFRDCFVNRESEQPEIHIYTRVGGGNRQDYQEEIKALRSHPNYLHDFDDDFDSTFATFSFSVPNEFKEDFDKIMSGDMLKVSDAYKERLKKTFPKLEDKFNEMFS